MEAKYIIIIVIIAAVAFLAIIASAIYVSGRNAYSDEEIQKAVRIAYAERGQDPNDLSIEKIVEVGPEREDGRSEYDIRIKFISGSNEGKTYSFRYYFIMMKGDERTLCVENVTAAPAGSALLAQ